MPHRKPVLSYDDFEKLMHLLDDDSVSYIASVEQVERLRRRLKSALKVPGTRIPVSVIGLGCRVVLSDITTGERDVFTLVDPAHADIASGRLSVLSPLGTAILGRHLGQQVRVSIPSGTRCVSIEAIDAMCQPKATSTAVNTVVRI